VDRRDRGARQFRQALEYLLAERKKDRYL